jgi:hypothetical protein
MGGKCAAAATTAPVVTADEQVDVSDVPLTLTLVAIGLFRAGFSAKHYERFKLHMARAKAHRDARVALDDPQRRRELPWIARYVARQRIRTWHSGGKSGADGHRRARRAAGRAHRLLPMVTAGARRA